ncbi:hypothetical protein [Dankookia sp. P2]|uniref:hypothetical protein n=1 Tax=Dankookia sp. P2 TaxID=3423955 RepID=UPI003D67028E
MVAPDRLSRALAMVTSQGVISLGFFATNLLLIRNIAPDDFGAYATILGIFFLAANFFGASVVYPMTLEAAKPDAAMRGCSAPRWSAGWSSWFRSACSSPWPPGSSHLPRRPLLQRLRSPSGFCRR